MPRAALVENSVISVFQVKSLAHAIFISPQLFAGEHFTTVKTHEFRLIFCGMTVADVAD